MTRLVWHWPRSTDNSKTSEFFFSSSQNFDSVVCVLGKCFIRACCCYIMRVIRALHIRQACYGHIWKCVSLRGFHRNERVQHASDMCLCPLRATPAPSSISLHFPPTSFVPFNSGSAVTLSYQNSTSKLWSNQLIWSNYVNIAVVVRWWWHI